MLFYALPRAVQRFFGLLGQVQGVKLWYPLFRRADRVSLLWRVERAH